MSTQKQEGIYSVPWFAQRKQKIATLLQTAREKKTVVIRSPPFTGKTSVCQLLTQHFNHSQTRNFFVNCLELTTTETFEQFFTRTTNHKWEDLIRVEEEVFIFTDETQKLFGDEERFSTFWNTVRLIGQQTIPSKLRIIIFSPFVDDQIQAKANHTFGIHFLKCSTEDEGELFDNFQNHSNIALSTQIRFGIAKEASHHIGYISAILDYIANTFASLDDTIRSTPSLMETKILELLFSRGLFEFLCSTRASPSFRMDLLTSSQKECLRTILLQKSLKLLSHNSQDIHHLIQLGYIWYKDEKKTLVAREEEVIFSSAVMRKLTMHFLVAANRVSEVSPKLLYVRIGNANNMNEIYLYEYTLRSLQAAIRNEFPNEEYIQQGKFKVRMLMNRGLFPVTEEMTVAKLPDETIVQIDFQFF